MRHVLNRLNEWGVRFMKLMKKIFSVRSTLIFILIGYFLLPNLGTPQTHDWEFNSSRSTIERFGLNPYFTILCPTGDAPEIERLALVEAIYSNRKLTLIMDLDDLLMKAKENVALNQQFCKSEIHYFTQFLNFLTMLLQVITKHDDPVVLEQLLGFISTRIIESSIFANEEPYLSLVIEFKDGFFTLLQIESFTRSQEVNELLTNYAAKLNNP